MKPDRSLARIPGQTCVVDLIAYRVACNRDKGIAGQPRTVQEHGRVVEFRMPNQFEASPELADAMRGLGRAIYAHAQRSGRPVSRRESDEIAERACTYVFGGPR